MCILPVSLPIKGWFAKCLTKSFKDENSLKPNLNEYPVYSTWKCLTESLALKEKKKGKKKNLMLLKKQVSFLKGNEP